MGVEAGQLAIEFRRDKIVFLIKSTGEHFTLHFGSQSGVLDVHRTWIDEHGAVRRKTVFAMHRANLSSFFTELSPQLNNSFAKLIRRLRLGWLARHGIDVARGLEFVSDEDIASVTRKNRRKRLVFEEAQIRHHLCVLECLDDIWDFPDGPFSLFNGTRRIGIAFKITDGLGWPKLLWIKVHDIIHFCNELGPIIISTAQRYAIPQEKYSEYCFLISNKNIKE